MVISIDYNEDIAAKDYQEYYPSEEGGAYLDPETKQSGYNYCCVTFRGEKTKFKSSDFVKDWFEAIRFAIKTAGTYEGEADTHIVSSSAVDWFAQYNGAIYDTAYLDSKGAVLSYDYIEDSFQFFVPKGSEMTWEQLKCYCTGKACEEAEEQAKGAAAEESYTAFPSKLENLLIEEGDAEKHDIGFTIQQHPDLRLLVSKHRNFDFVVAGVFDDVGGFTNEEIAERLALVWNFCQGATNEQLKKWERWFYNNDQ